MPDHNLHQTDLPLRMQILNISVNMARMGELVLKFGEAKADLVKRFLVQTESYLSDLRAEEVGDRFKPTLDRFCSEFERLKEKDIGVNRELWAERAITWGDILQIRSQLLSKQSSQSKRSLA